MGRLKYIIVHHSASNWGCARVIDEWHKERGFDCIGYHFVVLNGYTNLEDYRMKRKWNSLDGQIEVGRMLDKDNDLEKNEIGAHALGFNKESVGICLIHRDDDYQIKQKSSLLKLLREIISIFEIDINNVRGHYEINDKKPDCPGFDMDEVRKDLRALENFG